MLHRCPLQIPRLLPRQRLNTHRLLQCLVRLARPSLIQLSSRKPHFQLPMEPRLSRLSPSMGHLHQQALQLLQQRQQQQQAHRLIRITRCQRKQPR